MATRIQERPPREAAPGKKWILVTKVQNGMEAQEWVEVDDVAGPNWPARETLRVLDHDIRRIDGPEKVDGRARYAHDVRPAGLLYARFLCCPHPAAKVTLDLEPARAVPGVAHVRSLLDGGQGETRTLGQPIAVAVGRTPKHADDGLAAIVARFEPQPFAVTRAQALAEGAAQVGRNGNVREEREQGDRDATEEALAAADAVVDATYSLPIQHHVCLETHGLVVEWRDGDVTVHASTQGTFSVLDEAPGPLGLERGNVTVQVPFMGGGFGSKFGIGAEGRAACEIARELERSVHFLLTREAEFLNGGNRSGAFQHVRAGGTKDGTLTALSAEIDRLGGIGRGSHAGLPYIYACGKSHMAMRSVHTNTDGARAFRAPGHPQASFAMESVLDELAYALGVDLLTIRLKNLPERGRDVYERQLARAAREIGWDEHPHKAAWDSSESWLKSGIGFGLSTWGGGGSAVCEVDVRIDRDGGVSVLCGTQDLGTGTRTYMAAIAAEEFGLDPAAIAVRVGDSRLGRANPSGGSTTTASLAPAVKDACYQASRAFLERMAQSLGVPAARLSFAAGQVVDSAGARLAWKDACQRLGAEGIAARGTWQAQLAGNGVHGATAVKVEVDTLTGGVRVVKMVAVQDCGLPLNRTALRSQIHGGMIQALSYGLLEERVIDPDTGWALNADLENYKIAGCTEMPELVALIDDGDTRNVVIGMAEPAVISGQSALANAVHNACGVRVRDLPVTADKVLMGLEALRARGGRNS